MAIAKTEQTSTRKDKARITTKAITHAYTYRRQTSVNTDVRDSSSIHLDSDASEQTTREGSTLTLAEVLALEAT